MKYKKLEALIRKTKSKTEWIEKLHKIKDFNYIDDDGMTPLGISAYYANVDACKYILDHGGNPNIKNKYGQTPLYIAIENLASKGHNFHYAEEIINLFINNGADINAYDNDGKSILMLASQGLNTLWIEHKKIVQKLIKKGANVHAKDIYGITVFMYAAGSGNYDIVEQLIKKGIDIHAKDEDDRNALYYAVDYDCDSGYQDDLKNQKKSKEKIIQLLLNKNISIDTSDKNTNDTLLHIAGYYGCNKLVRLCIKAKADINAQNNSGRTALINAAIKGYADIVDMLLMAGANPNIKDKDKKTAMWYAGK